MLQAVIVGAGFSGICAGIALKKAGIEKAAGVGGTWRDNTYPGAACDIPSHLYSYSFEPNPGWSRAYGDRDETTRRGRLAKLVIRTRIASWVRLARCGSPWPSR